MSGNIYLHLLILCGILCQEIIATLSEDNTKESSDFLLRKKRVINHVSGEQQNIPRMMKDAFFVVNIKEYNRGICAGTILSRHTIITAAFCARHEKSVYNIYSGSLYDQESNIHNVTSKITYFGNPPYESLDGIALMNVHPPFVYGIKTGKINLFTGLLSAGREVTVYGWGSYYPLLPRGNARPRLRSITLPIMNHGECQNIYRTHLNITDKHICTHHDLKCCGDKDIGAPLVVANTLAGIHVWKGEFLHQKNPEVYVNLVRSEYSEWIREHTVNE